MESVGDKTTKFYSNDAKPESSLLLQEKKKLCRTLQTIAELLKMPNELLAMIADYALGLHHCQFLLGVSFAYQNDFDMNGILYWIGCSRGVCIWPGIAIEGNMAEPTYCWLCARHWRKS